MQIFKMFNFNEAVVSVPAIDGDRKLFRFTLQVFGSSRSSKCSIISAEFRIRGRAINDRLAFQQLTRTDIGGVRCIKEHSIRDTVSGRTKIERIYAYVC